MLWNAKATAHEDPARKKQEWSSFADAAILERKGGAA